SRPAPTVAVRPTPTTTEMAFSSGFRAIRRGDYGEAAEQFSLAIASAPSSDLASDARYWRGVAPARARDAAGARDALADSLARAPRSARAGEASVMLGWLLLDHGDLADARRRFSAGAADPAPDVRAGAARGLAAVEHRRGR